MTGKNKIILLDTNILIRYLLGEDDKLGKENSELLDKIQLGHSKAIILESVFAECEFVLTKVYNIPRNKVCESLNGLLKYKGIVNSDKDELLEALNIYLVHNLHIVDSILLAKAKFSNYSLSTLDKKLLKVYKTSSFEKLEEIKAH